MKRTLVRLGVLLLSALAVTAVLLALLTPFTADDTGGYGATATEIPDFRVNRLGERDHELTVDSAALGRDGMVRVLLPAGWKPGSGPWPVLYLLNGCCQAEYDSWITDGEAARLTAGYRALVVVPEGGAVGFYSDWRDGPGWETFHLIEIRQILESEYGAGERRAVAGLSMGGFGAMSYAARHPGMFQAAASFSGVLDTRDGETVSRLLERHGESPAKLWGAPRDPAWAAHNPADLTGSLRGVRLFVSSGDGSPGPLDVPAAARDDGEATLFRQTRTFTERALANGVEVTADLYGPGTHTWPYWRRGLERALPMLMGSIGAAP
ncbi:S-formylglutathione hydrolase FrmB [Streptosporangium becharense]|uniref:S-formylglutathione hydrolase FrmB n=1 Tax=Streptosporangium becharense TaxID=1816182 RepID=A0A7W9MJ55_9ACTN|nr:alpha/beta hydrolase family protein [Streptosporangium becharense]MBB2910154.1 S-formylglutathione hydrolase FrmB [Streptosporangium becharense]MBB5822897.1 S-formylglutathione hydrolase FrmB [Streptosporangium becharense]